MHFFNTLNVLNYHPLSQNHKIKVYLKYLKYRTLHKLLPHPFIYSSPYYKNRVKIIIKDLEQYQIIYTQGFPEFYELCFLLHFLRSTDTFVDIGANRGLFSILASGYVGSNSYAFEPVPATYDDLRENVRLNGLEEKIIMINAGLGSQNSKAFFSTNLGSSNSIITEVHQIKDPANFIEVQIYSLDEILSSPISPALLKIDVEGFETEVLRGATDTLQNSQVKALIIELNGAGEKFNYNDQDIHANLLKLGFRPFRYYPFLRKLELQNNYKSFVPKKYMSDNTIYVRDYEFVAERISSAEKINAATISF